MPRSAQETRQLFDRWATTYANDAQAMGGILTGYTESLQIAAEMVDGKSGARLLDIGIGTGGFAALFECADMKISGIDVSPKMLEQCARLHPDYELREGNFNAIPFDDAAFGMIISSFAFHETAVDARGAACREMQRVLQPGGVLCLLDIMFASPSAVDEARTRLGAYWDDSEDYAHVAALDTHLREADFTGLQWRQTTPCHWVVVGRG